jgi:hypothetical protein
MSNYNPRTEVVSSKTMQKHELILKPLLPYCVTLLFTRIADKLEYYHDPISSALYLCCTK